MAVFESLFSNVESIVSTFGPAGVFLAMLLETVFPPIPSEVVMPFAGYLAFVSGQGLLGLFWFVLAGTLGATLGAVIIYYVAMLGGRALVLRYGRRFMLDKKKLALVEKWFDRHGAHAVFLCRMAPGLRELISIPAGLARMSFPKFLGLTFSGSFIWSAFLGGIGFFLADAWRSFSLGSLFNVVALAIILALVAYFALRHVRNLSKKSRKRRRT